MFAVNNIPWKTPLLFLSLQKHFVIWWIMFPNITSKLGEWTWQITSDLQSRSICLVILPLPAFPESPQEILLLNYQGYFCPDKKIIFIYWTPTVRHTYIYWAPLYFSKWISNWSPNFYISDYKFQELTVHWFISSTWYQPHSSHSLNMFLVNKWITEGINKSSFTVPFFFSFAFMWVEELFYSVFASSKINNW